MRMNVQTAVQCSVCLKQYSAFECTSLHCRAAPCSTVHCTKLIALNYSAAQCSVEFEEDGEWQTQQFSHSWPPHSQSPVGFDQNWSSVHLPL